MLINLQLPQKNIKYYKNTDSINHSILANDNKIAENQNFQKNIPTAEKSVGRKKYDFNLKKAVVYSIILEKRFDF